MMIVLQDLFNTLCLYDIRLGGTKLLYEDLNKIFLLLFVAAFVTIKHRHYVHPQLLPYILILIVALYLCPGDLELQCITCGCHIHAPINICQNMKTLVDKVVFVEVLCRE